MTAPELAQQVDVKHIEGKKLAEHKQPQDALRVYDEAIAIAGNDPGLTAWVRFDKGKTLTSLGRFQEALGEFQQAQGYLGENTWVFTEIGNAHIGMKQLNNAEQEFTLALKGNPENWEASQGLERVTQMRQQAEHLHVLGVQKLNAGDREGAQQAYREAINLVGAENAPWSVFDLGKTLEAMGRHDEALVQLERSKQLLPGVIWPDVEIGNVFLAQKDVIKAETLFHDLETLFPDSDIPKERLAHIQKLKEEAGQEVSQIETLEQKAERLAKETREKGMGYLHGKFPPTMERTFSGHFQTINGFIQGEETNGPTSYSQSGNAALENILRTERRPDGQKDVWDSYETTYRQLWTVRDYNPPTVKREIKTGRVFKKKQTVEEYATYNGKHGEKGWVQYDYFMPVSPLYDQGSRPGIFVNLTVAVPPELATEMDRAFQANPLFADAYVKALYPDTIGEDVKTHIKREPPATEILVRDLRKNPVLSSFQLIQYPNPIPY